MDEAGKIHIYTGEGKGKSTAAAGLAARALGAGLKVVFVQFIKDGSSSEFNVLKTQERFVYKAAGQGRFMKHGGVSAEDKALAREGFAFACDAMKSGSCDLLAMDEIFCALSYALIDAGELVAALKGRAPCVEVVLTGRNPPPEILEIADLVTEMRCVRHYYKAGRMAVKGIEF